MEEQKKNEYGQIYDENIDKIFRFIFLKVNSQEIAEDLASETFTRGWRAYCDKNCDIQNIRAFLYQIARNLIVDHYRAKGASAIFPADCEQIIDPKTDLANELILGSDIDRVRTALADLKDEHREVITMRYIDDLSFEEISKIMGKSEGAVRVALHRATNSLREKINGV